MKKDNFGRSDLDDTLNDVTNHPERGLGLLSIKGTIILVIIVIIALLIYVMTQ
ncbi:hypothetical protein [Leuconostoc falkenbergense]|jgi:hypothetical protein|uniref:hypothetical protein n=1 Tax=Leuconostoc falkenbergense TaxID=2766470 RepID=UPI00117303CB|nr:hypothetical protein [Leuconostoc falkenbergense]MDV3545321.1 hypothetical protein [Leuconostoc falkenbergense]VTU69719.1 hypothetical protein AMBR_MGDJBKAP_01281 [Leuconostoc pseudomesenteroides]